MVRCYLLTIPVFSLMLCGITGCAAHQQPTPVAMHKTVEYPVITRLVSRHYTVVVAAGPEAPLYSVTGEKGQALTDHVTLAAMKLSNPGLFNRIAPALAMGAVDASAGD